MQTGREEHSRQKQQQVRGPRNKDTCVEQHMQRRGCGRLRGNREPDSIGLPHKDYYSE